MCVRVRACSHIDNQAVADTRLDSLVCVCVSMRECV